MNRKLLQEEKLDARTLMAFLDDTILLNSVLFEAGIKTSGERLKIIMTLKTIERESNKGNHLNTGRFPRTTYTHAQLVQDARFVDGFGVNDLSSFRF